MTVAGCDAQRGAAFLLLLSYLALQAWKRNNFVHVYYRCTEFPVWFLSSAEECHPLSFTRHPLLEPCGTKAGGKSQCLILGFPVP